MTESIGSITAVEPSALAEAHRYCARIAKSAAGNFYYAFILLPKAQRQGIQALYAFCRAGDDAADDPNPFVRSRGLLASLRRELDLCYEGLYDNLITLALADAVHRFRFDRSHFDDLLLGIESDLSPTRYRTLDDLYLYCYRVASTVGLLCLRIFGADTERAREYAVELGLGMQLTNIIRDIREDYLQGRIYIPDEQLERFQLTRETLFEETNRERLRCLMVSMIEMARARFVNASRLAPPELRSKLVAARAMGRIYETILDRIESDPLRLERVELTRREKLALARATLLGR